MGRYTGPACRLCRREGKKLFLKGNRCYTKSCSLEKREFSPPGMHSWKREKLSEYGKRLREKQIVKRYYGVFEGQFRRYVADAQKSKINTGEALLITLERRIDNVITRAKFAYSRRAARQLVRHGHVKVNGKKVDIPSYLVNVGDVIEVAPKETLKKYVQTVLDGSTSPSAPSWIEITKDPATIKVVQLPTRSEIQLEVKEQLIVEFCSR